MPTFGVEGIRWIALIGAAGGVNTDGAGLSPLAPPFALNYIASRPAPQQLPFPAGAFSFCTLGGWPLSANPSVELLGESAVLHY